MLGSEDAVIDRDVVQQFAARAPNSNFHRWPGMRHELHNGPGSDAVIAALCDWLHRTCREPSADIP
jgi:alpha-beta hydrolase superfamily lysophospholipase